MLSIVIATIIAVGFAALRRLQSSVAPTGGNMLIDRGLARLGIGPLAERLGWRPTFGYLQRAVIDRALTHRTVSITGDVWLPHRFTVGLHPEDADRIAHLSDRFAKEVAMVLASSAERKGWRMDGPGEFTVVRDPASELLRPTVAAVHGDRDPASGGNDASASGRSRSTRERRDLSATHEVKPGAMPGTVPGSGCSLIPVSGDLDAVSLGSADTECVLGRGPNADAIIAVGSVSWLHARLERTPTGWTLSDLGSSNGTLLNGRLIATDEAIHQGDMVSLGKNVNFRFVDHRSRFGPVRAPTELCRTSSS